MKKTLFALPLTVVLLAVIGLLINISTTMIYSQLAMYMKNVLGASAFQAATVDGIVESISHITRIASGVVSDLIQNRKSILVIGYALAVLAKPLYLFSSTIVMVFCAQSLDRLGNGTIASPRDALIGDVTPKPKRGASYGFIRSLKTGGSVLGAMIAMIIMYATMDSFITVFAMALIPSLIAFVILIVFIKEPKRHSGGGDRKRFRITKDNLKKLGGAYWKIILLSSFFELAHFSETLLSWRANDAGLEQTFVAFVMVAMNVGQFLVAYPLGMLSDKFPRRLFLILGFFFMLGATICMGYSSNLIVVMLGVFLWGAQMSTTQSIFLSLISDEVEKELRGTAFGIFYFTSGICYLIASQMAGILWDKFGYVLTFSASAIISILSILWAVFGFRLHPQKKEV